MNRREFLGLSILGVLASCQVEPSKSGKATATPFKPSSSTVASSNWSAFAKSLQGMLVRPDSPQYASARQLFNPRFDSILPEAIAYCASLADVQSCLIFARQFGLPLALRAGGHSYGGYSTTTSLVLDVTRMNTVTVDANNGTATVGAGARLIDVYEALAPYGLVLPAGSCPTVGIAGLTLGGGVGVLGRKFGLTCDNLLAAQIVLADGRVLICDASHNPDLFWALRGGGGGNFGVVTSFTFQVHQVATLSLFTLNWLWSSAVDVVSAWQAWALLMPDELWSNCLLLATSDKSSGPVVRVNGVYVGDVTTLNSLLQQLTSQIDAVPTSRYVSDASLLDTMLYEAGCYGQTVDECHLPNQTPQGQIQRETFSAKSDYFANALPRSGIDALVSAITVRQGSSTLGAGGVGLDAWGGAINRVAKDATAFAHRDALFSAQYTADWNVGDPDSVITASHSWLTNMWQEMRQYASGATYQNYIDPDLTDWQHAYYGTNLLRLQRIKAFYDPDNLFHFPQSISLKTGV
jgi:FAD/FMN-containing dehydrogenase